MLDLIYAAETQFRLDSHRLDRDLKQLAAIRERSAHAAEPVRVVPTAPRRAARTWPRPIGVAHLHPA